MATTSEIAQQIDRDLRLAIHELLDLSGLEADWENARKSGDRSLWLADWSGREIEWRDMATRIDNLSYQYRNGQMTDAQTGVYREMVALLRERAPILKRMKWLTPLVAVDSLA